MEKSGFRSTSSQNEFNFVADGNEFCDLETDADPQVESESNMRSLLPAANQNFDLFRANEITNRQSLANQIPDIRIPHLESNYSGTNQQQLSENELVDVAIVYSKYDYEDMLNFIDWLQSLLNLEGIYDCIIVPFDDDEYFCQDKIQNVEDVVSKATHAFMFLTQNFVRDVSLSFFNSEAIAQTRLAQDSEASRFASIFLMKNKYAVRPVHTEKTSSRRYRTPSGLHSLMSIDYYDKHTKHTCMKTTQLLKNAIAKRKNIENQLKFQQRKKEIHEVQRNSEYENDENLFQVPSNESIQRLQQHRSMPTKTFNFQETQSSIKDTSPSSDISFKSSKLTRLFDGSSYSIGPTNSYDKVERSNQDQVQGRDSKNSATADKVEGEIINYDSRRFKSDSNDASCQVLDKDQFQIKEDIKFSSGPAYIKSSRNMTAPSLINDRGHLTENYRWMSPVYADFNNQGHKPHEKYFPKDKELLSNDSWQEDGGFPDSFSVNVPRVRTHKKYTDDKKTLHIHHYYNDQPAKSDLLEDDGRLHSVKGDLTRNKKLQSAKTGMIRSSRNPISPHYNLIGCSVVQIGSSNAVQQSGNVGCTRGQIKTAKEPISRYSITDDDGEEEGENDKKDIGYITTENYRNNQDIIKRNIRNTEIAMENNLSRDQSPSDSFHSSGTLSTHFNIQHQELNKKKDEEFYKKSSKSEENIKNVDTSNFWQSTPFKRYSSSDKFVKRETDGSMGNHFKKSSLKLSESYTKLSLEQPESTTVKNGGNDEDKDLMYKSLKSSLESNATRKDKQSSYTTQIKEGPEYMENNCQGQEKKKPILQYESDTSCEEQLLNNMNDTGSASNKKSIFKEEALKFLPCESDVINNEQQAFSKTETTDNCCDVLTDIIKDQNLKTSALKCVEEQVLINFVNSESFERNKFKVGYIFEVDQTYIPGCPVQRKICTCPPVHSDEVSDQIDNNDSDDLD
ncbi:hypothetical protein KUTeg_020989 [Tegillarca granosa]|uniref:TIR domain-containing protein n=1 Tax=Tegillarca granosa TaxID=220873 RepID=A0ABQ9E9K2_TEGGR|nr:hypothetical protein KUTeg_020989 [Tegillarca granosa]